MIKKDCLGLFIIISTISLFIVLSSYILQLVISTNHVLPEKRLLAANLIQNRNIKETNLHKEITPEHLNERINLNNQTVFLTFDDGPNRFTKTILDILKKKNAKATFFFLKENIKKYEHTVNRAIKEGHSVGCHGVSHTIQHFYTSVDTAVEEMEECQNALYHVTRKKSPLIRVPFGSYPNMTTPMEKALEEKGFIYWDWNIDSRDWSTTDLSYLIDNIKQQMDEINDQSPPTILLHDHPTTTKLLPILIDQLREQEYMFLPIPSSVEPVQFNRFEDPLKKHTTS